MDTEDTNKSAKAVKAAKTVSSQDQVSTSNTMGQPEWPTSYFNAGKASLPPGYYPSPIASSPPGHPYAWGPQHMMAPYAPTPTPYMPVYSPGAMYTHPSITAGTYPYSSFGLSSGAVDETTTGALPVGTEVLAKSSEPKDQIPSKNFKAGLGSLNVLTRKNSESTKGMTTNGVFSQSAESGSDESSDRSNEDSAPGSQAEKKLTMDQVSTEVNNSQNGSRISPYTSSQSMQMQGMIGSQTVAMNSNPGVPMMALSLPTTSGIISGPMTNLNIGMDVWGGTSITPSAMRGGLSSPNAVIPQNMSAAAGSHEPPMMDEREIKRQKRKLSNRESARRSRQRKQAECEELQRQVGALKDENDSLRAELAKMRSQCEKLSSENASLMQKVQSLCGNECIDFRNKADQQNIESEN